ncbi:hypothetical protein HER10_EVM0011239 [Colletotrichum scovillei]|uniref:uncharacterized protein n=1 Tax=Colletotrichum scovillei TaxID=1209932 RepID=UPI0015C3E129|nr:uncharacterized protein HER10_EVM0011239 [Colletotrichum scovillei]KAF4777067.1 hypothetical protein HER10_EVM0011239 [Colletotrichum scovillei]
MHTEYEVRPAYLIAAGTPIKPVRPSCGSNPLLTHTGSLALLRRPQSQGRAAIVPKPAHWPRARSWNYIPSPTRFELALHKYNIRTRCRNRTCGTPKVRDSTVHSSTCNTVCWIRRLSRCGARQCHALPNPSQENCSEPTCELPTTTDRIWAPPTLSLRELSWGLTLLRPDMSCWPVSRPCCFRGIISCRTRMPLRQRHASLEAGWPTGGAGEITPNEVWPRSWKPCSLSRFAGNSSSGRSGSDEIVSGSKQRGRDSSFLLITNPQLWHPLVAIGGTGIRRALGGSGKSRLPETRSGPSHLSPTICLNKGQLIYGADLLYFSSGTARRSRNPVRPQNQPNRYPSHRRTMAAETK